MVCINLSNRRGLVLQIISDISFIILLSTIFVVIHYGIKPYHRGFFCADESLKHPILDDTVPDKVLLIVCLSFNIIVILLVEFTLREDKNICLISPKTPIKYDGTSWILRAYRHIVILIFGLAATLDFTELGKTTTGRLRPYFLTLCDPDLTNITCPAFITGDVCQSTDVKELKRARRSFPSGHASLSVYCAVFVVLYLQYRFTCTKGLLLLKPLVQMVLCAVSVWVCLTRVSDYKHHAGDVVAGALLGAALALVMVWGLFGFGKTSTSSSAQDRGHAPGSDVMLGEHSPGPTLPLYDTQSTVSPTPTERSKTTATSKTTRGTSQREGTQVPSVIPIRDRVNSNVRNSI